MRVPWGRIWHRWSKGEVILWTGYQRGVGATQPRKGTQGGVRGYWSMELREILWDSGDAHWEVVFVSLDLGRGWGWRCLSGNTDVYVGQLAPSYYLKFSVTIFLLYVPPFPSASKSILGNHLPQTRNMVLSVLSLEAVSESRTIEKRQVQCF